MAALNRAMTQSCCTHEYVMERVALLCMLRIAGMRQASSCRGGSRVFSRMMHGSVSELVLAIQPSCCVCVCYFWVHISNYGGAAPPVDSGQYCNGRVTCGEAVDNETPLPADERVNLACTALHYIVDGPVGGFAGMAA